MVAPTTITSAYHVDAIGTLSVSDLASRLAAVPYDPTLPILWGAVLVSDVTSIVGSRATRTFVHAIASPNTMPVAETTIEAGEVGAPVISVTVSSPGDILAGVPYVTFPPEDGEPLTRPARAACKMQLQSVAVIKGGSGYSSSATLRIVGGVTSGGAAATGRVHVSGGQVVAAFIDSVGTYGEMPRFYVDDLTGSGAYVQGYLGLQSVNLIDGGGGFLSPPSVDFTPLYYRNVAANGVFTTFGVVTPLRGFMQGQLQSAMGCIVVAEEPITT